MISGHGDDAYKYDNIRMDFSSNICAHHSHEALMAHLTTQANLLDHYPEPEAWSLERIIAEQHAIDPACVIVTSGATDAIYLIAQTFHYRPVIPQPTFSEYEDACRMFGYDNDTSKSPTALWLCNPNNPTGEVYDQFFIDRMMGEHELVVLDQSYENYTQAHVMSPQEGCQTPHFIQIHSMTKMYGVPGLRLGYITAHEHITQQIRRYLRPWNVSALAIEAGKYLLKHNELICRPDLNEAQLLRNKLLQIQGINVLPTQTNFMLCHTARGNAAEIKDILARQYGMLIRDASNFEGLSQQHFRIATQTADENDALVSAISDITRLYANR